MASLNHNYPNKNGLGDAFRWQSSNQVAIYSIPSPHDHDDTKKFYAFLDFLFCF